MKLLSLLSIFGSLMVLSLPIARAQAPDFPNLTSVVVWSPDSAQIAVATFYGSIQLLNSTGQTIRTLQEENSTSVFALAWSPDGLRLASGGDDSQVTIWDIASGNDVGNYQYRTYISDLSWHPDNIHLAFASSSASKGGVVWNTLTGETIFQISELDVYVVAWNPDGSLLASTRWNKIQIWDPFATNGEQLVRTIETEPQNIIDLDWNSDGTRLASSQIIVPENSVVNIWDMNTGKLTLSYKEHTNGIPTVVWSPDGCYLASASTDGTVRIWDSVKGHTVETIRGNSKMIAVDWSPDGTKIAYGTMDGEVEIIDAPLSDCPHPIAELTSPDLN